MVKEVKFLNFNREVSQNEKKVVILFGASWCLACREIMPLFERWSLEYPTYDFKYVDLSVSKRFIKRFNISATPTFILFENKNIIKSFVGIQTDETFEYFLLNK